MGVLTFLVSGQVRRSLEARAVEQNTVAARLAANAAREHFEGLTRYVESFARRPLLATLVQRENAEGLRAHLKDLVTQHGSLDRAFITDPRGRLWYDYPHAREVIGQDFSFRDWYRGVSATQTTYVSEVYQRAAPPQPYLVAVATPIHDGRRRPLGYLVAQHTLETLTDWLAQVKPSRRGAVALIDHHGVLAMMGPSSAGPPPPLGDHPVVRRALAGEAGSLVTADPLTGEPSLVSYWPVGPIGWVVLSRQPTAVVLAPVRALQRTIVGLAGVSFLAMFGLGALCLNTIRRYHQALLESDRAKDRTLADLKRAVTERERAEEEVTKMNARLAAVNKELEAFTYTVSHDLKAPLRGMEGFARALDEDYADRLDEAGHRYLGMIRTSARRMGELIDDLLRYSRLERREVRRERVPLRPLLEGIRQELEEEIRGRGLTVQMELAEEGVEAEPEGLREALANLIENAVKFNGEGGAITIATRREGSEVLLSVADTGVGFDMTYHDRIFRIFERLHRQEEYPGTGVGLAIVRKVAERHGGRAWADSEPGKGSTFYLALPAGAGGTG
jgi:signal transduction histidine kinase